jgi:hypothetical protein
MAYTTINKSTDYFNTIIYDGNGTSQSITTGFEPSLVWSKTRNQTENPAIFDAVRGVGNVLFTNSTSAENAGQTNGVTAFNSTGYSVGTFDSVNNSSANLVSWNWKANGAGSANTDGTISSTVSANTTSGFSIVTFTGTGSAATVGHGLGSTPKMMIVKRLDASNNWFVYHGSLGGTKYSSLNATEASQTDSSVWNNTNPTSSVFTVNTETGVNGNGGTYIAYCFADVQGYSKFGSYTGNGNADGAFVYTGFKPAFVITKRTDGVGNWLMYDTKRIGYNPSNYFLFPHLINVEDTSNAEWLDLHSNGFKTRATSTTVNGSGNSYIYMAFAEAPLVGTNNVPCTAR